MKITKTAAEETAKQMANDSMNENIENSRNKLIEFVSLKVEQQVPEDLLIIFRDEKYENYFRTSNCFRVSYENKCDYFDYISLNSYFPVKNGDNIVDLQKKDYDQFVELLKRKKELIRSKEYLIKRIYNAVLSMGTVKRLEKEFPEAFEAMPEQFKTERVSTTIAVPVDDILKELNFYKD